MGSAVPSPPFPLHRFPAGHSSHCDAPAYEYVPAGHASGKPVASVGHFFPAGHGAHSPPLSRLLYCPVAHAAVTTPPEHPWPKMHGVGSAVPSAAHSVPAGHATHAVCSPSQAHVTAAPSRNAGTHVVSPISSEDPEENGTLSCSRK